MPCWHVAPSRRNVILPSSTTPEFAFLTVPINWPVKSVPPSPSEEKPAWNFTPDGPGVLVIGNDGNVLRSNCATASRAPSLHHAAPHQRADSTFCRVDEYRSDTVLTTVDFPTLQVDTPTRSPTPWEPCDAVASGADDPEPDTPRGQPRNSTLLTGDFDTRTDRCAGENATPCVTASIFHVPGFSLNSNAPDASAVTRFVFPPERATSRAPRTGSGDAAHDDPEHPRTTRPDTGCGNSVPFGGTPAHAHACVLTPPQIGCPAQLDPGELMKNVRGIET